MNSKASFDTNVLLYLVSDDATKQRQAERVTFDGGVISVQALNETTNVLRTKARRSWSDINIVLEAFKGAFSVEPLTLDVHEHATVLSERLGYRIFDCLQLA